MYSLLGSILYNAVFLEIFVLCVAALYKPYFVALLHEKHQHFWKVMLLKLSVNRDSAVEVNHAPGSEHIEQVSFPRRKSI